MNSGSAQAWRLRVRGSSRGAGILVSPTRALTCAHVVSGRAEADVTFAWSGCPAVKAVPLHLRDWESRGRDADIAVLKLPALPDALPAAPLGPLRPLEPLTVLRAFGFPRGHETTGMWATVRCVGPDADGRCLQVDQGSPGGSQITPGFSGGPVVDDMGRVVGMSTLYDPQRTGTAWIIPLLAVARFWPKLRSLAPGDLETEPGFRAGMDALQDRAYDAAARHFRQLTDRFPASADACYYLALALLRGTAPCASTPERVESVLSTLRSALRRDRECAHARLLILLVEEDFYRGRRYGLQALDPAVLQDLIRRCSATHRQEIVTHFPDSGSETWRALAG